MCCVSVCVCVCGLYVCVWSVCVCVALYMVCVCELVCAHIAALMCAQCANA